MEALYDQTGRAYAWLDPAGNHVIGLAGEHLAFIHGDSVYTWDGSHIGWWHDDHIRDQSGEVVVFLSNAIGLGVTMSINGTKPIAPRKAMIPKHPMKATQPVQPTQQTTWCAEMPF